MARKAGFTLVELLVVIAIISLLVSILAPSLNIAKDLAKQVVCSTNLSSAGKAIMLYAESNDDKMPPHRSGWKNGAPSTAYLVCPESTFAMSKTSDVDGVTLRQRYRGVGMVYGSGFIESPAYFYCPGQEFPWFTLSSYEDPKQKKRYGGYSTITDMVRSGMLWNAWGQKQATPDVDGKYWHVAGKTMSSMVQDKPLGMDHALFFWGSSAHLAKGAHTPTFNIMYPDAHVEAATPHEAFLDTLQVNWGSILKNWAEVSGPNNDWEEAFTILSRS